jgi:molecular chaperone DnaK
LDVTVVRKDGKNLKVLATNGDHQLGGKDWDDCLIRCAAEKFEELYQMDPLSDPSAYQDLQLRAIQVKETLSRLPRCPLVVQYKGQSLKLDITGERFCGLAGPLVSRCRFICDAALEQAGCAWADLDDVLLVGGGTRMPMIRDMIRAARGRDGVTLGNPDEAVALGAAVAAAFYSAQGSSGSGALVPRAPRVLVSECTAHSLGTICKDSADRNAPDVLSVIIPRGAPVVGVYRERYSTICDNQVNVLFKVVEGETLESTTRLGEVLLTGLPKGPAGRPLSLELRYDASHVLTATACDLESGKTLAVQIKRSNDPSPTELMSARDAVLVRRVE